MTPLQILKQNYEYGLSIVTTQVKKGKVCQVIQVLFLLKITS